MKKLCLTFKNGTLRSTPLAAVMMAGLVAGCANIQPQPLLDSEIKEQHRQDLDLMQRAVPPLMGPLTLEEAIARALKFNFDNRLRAMEEAVASGQLDLSRYELLPKLVANAGYNYRNNDLITRSVDSVTGQPSLANPYISSDRTHNTADLTLSWSLLDFGLSYHNAKQNADKFLIASEKRRKATHLLIQDVRSAFYRVAVAQKLRDQVMSTRSLAEKALDDSAKVEKDAIRAPIESLRYQRQLLESLRLLESIDQELSSARIDLANLISLPMSPTLTVADPPETLNKAILEQPVEQLEEQALLRNADVREQFYNSRIAVAETKKAMLRMFPGLSFNYALKHDTDSYLINSSWREAGVSLSYNLFNILSYPTQQALADAGVQLADQRRMATRMAVMAQLHLARQQYADACRQFERADALWKVDGRISNYVANQETAGKQTRMDRIANDTTAIISQLRRYQALATAHAAASRLQATLGMQPTLLAVEDTPLPVLSEQLSKNLQQWGQGSAAMPEGEPAK